MAGQARDALVFTAPEGGPVSDGHFRNRVWYPAVVAAGIRRFPPRIMRHTAASWLVQDGCRCCAGEDGSALLAGIGQAVVRMLQISGSAQSAGLMAAARR